MLNISWYFARWGGIWIWTKKKYNVKNVKSSQVDIIIIDGLFIAKEKMEKTMINPVFHCSNWLENSFSRFAYYLRPCLRSIEFIKRKIEAQGTRFVLTRPGRLNNLGQKGGLIIDSFLTQSKKCNVNDLNWFSIEFNLW